MAGEDTPNGLTRGPRSEATRETERGGEGGGPNVRWHRVTRRTASGLPVLLDKDWEWMGRDDQGVLWGAKRL
jgi:hypothetical protein